MPHAPSGPAPSPRETPDRDRRPATPGGVPPILGPVPGAPEREEVAPEGQRFRRPERPATPASDARGPRSYEPDGGAEVRLATPLGDAAARSVEPLAALAAAFQANAEALSRSQEMQAELGRALQRADRSEVMIQSTGALNETFKGLTSVQRSLLQRVETAEEASKSGRWFLPLLVLGALAVTGAALALVVHKMDDVEERVVGNADLATQLHASLTQGVNEGRTNAEAAFAVERRVFEERVSRLEADLAGVRAERDARASELKEASSTLQGLQGEVMTARADSLRARAMEEELARLRVEGASKDPELDRLKRELAEEKRTNAGLRQRLADLGIGRGAPDPAAETPRPEEAAAAPAASPADDPALPRDRGGVERAKTRMNELLQGAAAGRPDYLQIVSLGGNGGTRLTQVMAARYSASGKLMSYFKAKDLRVNVDRSRRVVELVFTDGAIEYAGNSLPFAGGTYTAVVAEGDQVAPWAQSGLSFVAIK